VFLAGEEADRLVSRYGFNPAGERDSADDWLSDFLETCINEEANADPTTSGWPDVDDLGEE